MRIAVVHPGTQHASKLAAQLSRLGILDAFWTGFAYGSDSRMWRLAQRLLPSRLQLGMRNRAVADVPAMKIRSLRFFEMGEILRRSIKGEDEAFYHLRNFRFQQKVAGRATADVDGVIGFDTSSWVLARRCRDSRVRFFLDQSIAHPLARERIWDGVRRRYPEWVDTHEPRRPEVLAAEREEHTLADRIVSASSFTKRTLVEHGVEGGKILVNPYGVDGRRFHSGDRASRDRPLRFIFVGSLQARKGIPVLVDAWRRLAPRDAELWLVGAASAQARKLIPDLPGLALKGPISNADLPAIFDACDAFVFPSLFEGFGLVILEAMANGLPVITTDATAGPDVLTDGRDGFLVPAGDADALEARMRWCLENRDRIPAMGAAARRAAEPFTWEAYGERWAGIIHDVLG